MRIRKFLALSIAILCLCTTVKMQEIGIVARLVDFVEKNFIKVFLNDCTNARKFLSLNQNEATNSQDSKLASLILVLYGKKYMNFSLSEVPVSLLSSPEFNNEIPSIIVIHGHDDDPYSPEINPLMETLKKLNNSNLFALNHGRLMSENYYAASTHVRFIGEALGEVLAKLYFGGVKNVHLIGHSLGAHLSGFAGKTFKNITGVKINRITGLDPAGPCFFQESPKNRLTEADASFVDVIHTDINTSGYPHQLGHVDFYPNGGDNMPGCLFGRCSHVISIEYYRSSIIHPNIFQAVKCENWAEFKKGNYDMHSMISMGHWLKGNPENGKYYMETSSKFPYGIGNLGIMKKI